MENINYVSSDGSVRITLSYIRHNNLRFYRRGRCKDKCYPKTTQCLLFYNNAFYALGEVVKCESDPDNPKLAYMLATKKALGLKFGKEARKAIWRMFHERFDK